MSVVALVVIFGGLGYGVASIIGVTASFAVLEEFMTEYQQNGGGQFSNALASFNKCITYRQTFIKKKNNNNNKTIRKTPKSIAHWDYIIGLP